MITIDYSSIHYQNHGMFENQREFMWISWPAAKKRALVKPWSLRRLPSGGGLFIGPFRQQQTEGGLLTWHIHRVLHCPNCPTLTIMNSYIDLQVNWKNKRWLLHCEKMRTHSIYICSFQLWDANTSYNIFKQMPRTGKTVPSLDDNGRTCSLGSSFTSTCWWKPYHPAVHIYLGGKNGWTCYIVIYCGYLDVLLICWAW
jgi:hypothetical protein